MNDATLAKLQELQQAEKELAQLEAVYAELSADLTLTAASMAPPPAGTAADVVSFGRSLWKGDWGGALIDAIGIIPIAGDLVKGATKGTKTVASMKKVERALDAARIKIDTKKRALLNQERKRIVNPCKNMTIQGCPNLGGGKNSKGKTGGKPKGDGGIIGGKNTSEKKPKPEWLKKLDEGNEFNKVRSKEYPYNEVYIDKDGKYVRLDSYNPAKGEIVSRKHTQLSDIQEGTAKGYVKELKTKYPPGSKVSDVPSNKSGANSGILKNGDEISGQMVLEVPVQNNPIPKSVLDEAKSSKIIIRDTNGKIY